MDRWQQLQDDIGAFSDKTFGVKMQDDVRCDARAKALHLHEEAREAADDPADLTEWADCMILLLDAARAAGFNTEDVYQAVRRKMKVNEARTWGTPDENGVVRHIKSSGT